MIFVAMIAASFATAAPVQAAPDRVATSFVEMKTLVGLWRQADKPDSPLRIRFSLTAGGTVLVEEWLRGTQPHSLTLYHRNGGTLVATHYCPQGNQPRLTMLLPSSPNVLRFSFWDATDLDVAREAYLVALSFDLSNKKMLIRRETYRQAGVDEASELRLVREQ